MQCPNCGHDNSLTSRFCARCGYDVKPPDVAPPAPPPAPEGANPPLAPVPWGSLPVPTQWGPPTTTTPPPPPTGPTPQDPRAANPIAPPPYGAYPYAPPPPPPPGAWPQPVGGPYPPPHPGAWAPRTNGLAIASLVLGIVGWIPCGVGSIAAIIFGFVARTQIRDSRGTQTGEGMATAGIVLGFAWIGLIVTYFVVFALVTAHNGSS